MNILVIGDVMIDVNFYSKIERKAPEADIPIYNVEKTQSLLGGAANVARNLHNLKTTVELASVIGKDFAATKIKYLLDKQKIKYTLFIEEKRKLHKKIEFLIRTKLQCVTI